jgi:hypothetical protein
MKTQTLAIALVLGISGLAQAAEQTGTTQVSVPSVQSPAIQPESEYTSASVQLAGLYFVQINRAQRQSGKVQLSLDKFFASSTMSIEPRVGAMFVQSFDQPIFTAGLGLNLWTEETSRTAIRFRGGLVAEGVFNNRTRYFTGSLVSTAGVRSDFYAGVQLGARLGLADRWFIDVPVEAGVFTTSSPTIYAFNAGIQLGRGF